MDASNGKAMPHRDRSVNRCIKLPRAVGAFRVKGRWLWVCLFFLSSGASAQLELTFSGYAVDFPAYQRSEDLVARFFGVGRDQFVNVSRLRLRPALSLWRDAQLSLEYEISALYHSTPVLFQVQSEENSRQIADWTWNPIDGKHWTVLHYVDRLHFKQGFGFGDLVIGRQRIAWGTGRVWNPTDLFNPLNPASFAKIEKDGVDAALVKFHLGSFTDVSLVFNPQRGGKTSNAGCRFRTNVREFDLSVVGGRFDKRVIVGGDFAGNLFDAGVRGEGILSAIPDRFDSNFVKLILGIDYQFTSRLYGLVEYHFNGEGATDKSRYDLLRLAKGEIINVGRNYLAVQTSYLIHPLVNIAASWARNVDDRSQYLALVASYSATDEISVAFGGQLFLGNDFAEYWYYPDALYVKADIFF